MISTIIYTFLHIDSYLQSLISQYGVIWVYLILFLIIFCETGLVITPFLPGDSLLFIAGNIAYLSNMNLYLLLVILILSAIIGNNTNYLIGKFFSKKLFKNPNSKILKKKYLIKAEIFYNKHGHKAIFISRFIPVIRTFIPNIAGISNMNYYKFTLYNITSAIAWVSLFTTSGYFFGNINIIKENLNYIIVLIIFISIIPIFFNLYKNK